MIKKVTTLFIVFALTLLTANFVFADGKQPPPPSSKKGNFTKGEFSKKNSWSSNGKAASPPSPNGAGSTGGNRIPISNGLTFLLIGSTVYLVKRVREDKRNSEVLEKIENS